VIDLKLTEEELNRVLQLFDVALRAEGLRACRDINFLVQKIEAAVQVHNAKKAEEEKPE